MEARRLIGIYYHNLFIHDWYCGLLRYFRLKRHANLCFEQRPLNAEDVEAISAILGLESAYDGLEIHLVVACLRQQVEGHPRNHAGFV